MKTEVDRVKERYARRGKRTDSQTYSDYLTNERDKVYNQFIEEHFNTSFADLSLLEIGAGMGGNLRRFIEMGFMPHNLYGNELLEDRLGRLYKAIPPENIMPGDAMSIQEDRQYDIVFQSTVFSSILDKGFRYRLAQKMLKLTKPGGMVLWYDFTYNNPFNKDVRKVSKDEIKSLFSTCELYFRRVTLAPPIGRRVGSFYPLLNAIPFLRTHLAVRIVPF